MTEPIRRPGSPWRLLVHEYVGEQPDGTCYGTAHHVSNDREQAKSEGRWTAGHLLPANAEFDELVVGRGFIHIESKESGRWWMNIGGVTLWVGVNRDGEPTDVTVYGPGDYATAVPGCSYSLEWSGP